MAVYEKLRFITNPPPGKPPAGQIELRWSPDAGSLVSRDSDGTDTALSGGGSGGTVEVSELVTTSTNDNPAAGELGEYTSVVVPPTPVAVIPLTDSVPSDVMSLVLSAGDWDVEGQLTFAANVNSTITYLTGFIGDQTGVIDPDGTEVQNYAGTTSVITSHTLTFARKRLSLAAPTTIFMVGSAEFSAGAVDAYGIMNARRVR